MSPVTPPGLPPESFVSELDPTALWRWFDRILATPRPSGQEEAMRTLVIAAAEERGLSHASDEAGNLVVRKPAAAGRGSAPAVVLQAHLDMVTEKDPAVEHDFERDPIVPRREDGWLLATGTTLGADNGIGVAAMLAAMEAGDIAHGPLELLFTVDEERGLKGAARLDPALVTGRRLLNLDCEELGVVAIGCAGAGDCTMSLPLVREPTPPGAAALRLEIGGLAGGHSGVDIHRGRGNAVRLLARALHAGLAVAPLRLVSIRGGGKRNAIARDAEAVLAVPEAAAGELERRLTEELEAAAAELAAVEPELAWRLSALAPPPGEVLEKGLTERLLRLLEALPHGPTAMSREVPGLVETSVNLAAVDDGGRSDAVGGLRILLSCRSMIDSALVAQRRRLRAIGELAGAKVEENPGYPGWRPDPDNPLLATVAEVHRQLGEEPRMMAFHAGLECGLLGAKLPGMQMASIGPTIRDPHSPTEKIEIATVAPFYRILTGCLEALAEEG